jgi:hypothetical protein
LKHQGVTNGLMRKFLGDWRRTAECVAMVIAMLLADAWLISLSRLDSMEFHLLGQLNVIKSNEQHIDWIVIANSSWTDGRVWHVPYAVL